MANLQFYNLYWVFTENYWTDQIKGGNISEYVAESEYEKLTQKVWRKFSNDEIICQVE